MSFIQNFIWITQIIPITSLVVSDINNTHAYMRRHIWLVPQAACRHLKTHNLVRDTSTQASVLTQDIYVFELKTNRKLLWRAYVRTR